MRTLSVAICLAVLTCHAETTRSKKCEEMHFDMGADAVSPNSAWKLTMTESKVSGPYEVRIRFRATPPLFVDKYDGIGSRFNNELKSQFILLVGFAHGCDAVLFNGYRSVRLR